VLFRTNNFGILTFMVSFKSHLGPWVWAWAPCTYMQSSISCNWHTCTVLLCGSVFVFFCY
jgi:hypothetical protein